MAFVVQSSNGGMTGANAYITVAEFKSYHDDRGQSYGPASDSSIQHAIVLGTDYVDTRFQYVGLRQFDQRQLTQWPRVNAVTTDGMVVGGIPDEVKFATAELALRVINGTDLLPDPEATASGAAILSSTEKVGPLEERVTYANSGAYVLPIYPRADMMLKRRGLVRTGNILQRG